MDVRVKEAVLCRRRNFLPKLSKERLPSPLRFSKFYFNRALARSKSSRPPERRAQTETSKPRARRAGYCCQQQPGGSSEKWNVKCKRLSGQSPFI